jgi:AcrR family transcriptional regulator
MANTSNQAGAANRRTPILEAAARIVEREGAAHLTIDAVASEAELSKGGVLYHFRTKQALLAGMLERLLSESEERRSEMERAGESALTAWIKAEHDQAPAERAMALALLANAAEDPSLLLPARSFLREAFARFREEAADPDLSLILLFAVEGRRFLDMLGLIPSDAVELERLHERMLELAGSDQ